MFEPFLMLTVLNCFFMFSSTVTTCALWWQYKRNRRNCPEKNASGDKSKLKKSRSDGHVTAREHDKYVKIDKTGEIVQTNKRDKISSKLKKKDKDRKFTSTGIQSSPEEVSLKLKEEQPRTLDKGMTNEEAKRRAASPSSEAKSTIVMEVSTVQKVVQIIDNDREQQKILRAPTETVTIIVPPADSDRKIECVREKIMSDNTHLVEKCDI